MSTKSRIKRRDKYQCQICGDFQGRCYDVGVIVKVQSHHITPKSKGGENTIGNQITLCDFCHDILHPQKWYSQFGDKGTFENMEPIREDFDKYLKLDHKEREKIKRDLWKQFGIL